MRIGIMGGTFDPIHNGHLMIAEAAYLRFQLDKVWFMPNGNPPHKEQKEIGSAILHRVEMVKLAIEGHEGFCLQRYETEKKGVSYSYETMEHFKKQYPEDDFFFIIGADSLFAIEQWAHPERLFRTCTILATYRDEIDTPEEMGEQIQYLEQKYHAKIKLLPSPLLKISSSQIRFLCERNKSIDEVVPCKVKEYIRKEGLYESGNHKNI